MGQESCSVLGAACGAAASSHKTHVSIKQRPRASWGLGQPVGGTQRDTERQGPLTALMLPT